MNTVRAMTAPIYGRWFAGRVFDLVFCELYVIGLLAVGRFGNDPRLDILPGLSLNQLFVVPAMLVGLWLLRDNVRLYLRPAVLLFLCFVAWLGLSLLWTRAPQYGWDKWSGLASLGCLALVWGLAVGKRQPALERFLLVLGGVGSVMGLSGIGLWAISGGGARLAVLGGGPIVFGRWVATAIVVLFAWGAMRFKGRLLALAPLWLPVLAALLLALVLSGSKGPILGVTLAVMHMMWTLMERRSVLSRLLLLLGAVGLVVLALVLSGPEMLARLVIAPSDTTISGSYSSRFDYLGASWRMICENPWGGVGVGGWSIAFDHHDFRHYPHNILVEIVTETGLPFSMILIGAFCVWLRNSLRFLLADSSWTAMALRALLLFWLVAASFSGDFVDNRNFFLTLFLIEGARAARSPELRQSSS